MLQEIISDLYSAKIHDRAHNTIECEYPAFVEKIQSGISRHVLDLSRLQFGGGVLSRIQRVLRMLPEVNRMNVYGNLIRDTGIVKIFQILQSIPRVQYLDIGCNDITDSSIGCLTDMLLYSNLVSLQLGALDSNFQANRLTRYGLSKLLDALQKTNRIRALGLAGLGAMKQRKNGRYRDYSQHLAMVIIRCTELEVLDLSNSALVDTDQGPLSNAFSLNAKMKRLNLQNNSFPTGTRLVEGIVQLERLVSLNLCHCNLNEGDCMLISEQLKKGWNLISLNISENNFGPRAIRELLTVLADNIYITEINIADTGFNSSVAAQLKTFVQKNETVQVLNLAKNSLGDSICGVFDGTHLRKLNLSTCRITDVGVKSLCESIVDNDNLKHLALRDNFLTKEIGYVIVEILQKNVTITHVDVSSNRIDCFASDGINTLCMRNKTSKQNERLDKMRKEYIHLSIQKSKIPDVKKKLNKYNKEHGVLDDEITDLNSEIESVETQMNVALNSGYKAIVEFKKMIGQEEQQIEAMKVKIKDMKEQFDISMKDLTEKIAHEKEEFKRVEAEAGAMERKTMDYIRHCEAEEARMNEEIAKMEEMIDEITRITRNKKKLKDYEIPEYPYAEEESRIAAEKEEEQRRQREEALARERELFGDLDMTFGDVDTERSKKSTKSKKKTRRSRKE